MTTGREGIVVIDGLVKRYGAFEAVAGIDLDVRRGEVFGFLGPNGAGKTTTLECIVGLRTPTSGSVSVLGFDPARDREQITSRVAVQPQSASLLETLTVVETMRLFASFHENAQDAVAVLERVGLTDHGDVRTKNLSGGQLRRLLVGVALVGNPELVVLDEPSAGLDPAARQNLWSVISGLRERGITVLFSTHDMEEATALCDRVAILVAGRVVALDSPDELVRQGSAESTVTFTVPLGTALGPLLSFADEAAVQRHEVSDGIRITIVTGDPDELLRRITFTIALRAREFSVRRGSLEDIFLELADEPDARPEAEPRRRRRAAA